MSLIKEVKVRIKAINKSNKNHRHKGMAGAWSKKRCVFNSSNYF